MDFPSTAEQTERPYISTGHLPEPETVQKLVSDAHRRFKSNTDGKNSQVYPALARVPSELFGVCVVGTSGRVYEAGDTEYEFSIMSVSTPFVFALVCETIGPEEARNKLIVNVYDRLTPRQIGRYGFALCTIGLVWLAFVVRNDWSEVAVLFGLVLFGIGQGSLVTLLFNVLVTASPKELAGDVGSLRGTTQNLAAAVGTAVAGALLVGLLSTIVLGKIAANPMLPKEIQTQVDLDNITFVSNDRLRSVMENTTATPQQVQEAVRVNTEARLRALKIGLLIMAGLALLAVIPAGHLPNYLPGELPSDQRTDKDSRST